MSRNTIPKLDFVSCLAAVFAQTMGLLPDTQNCELRMRRECQEHFPRHRLQRKPLVSDPGMHHGTCVTARAVRHVGIANLRWRGKRSHHSRRMRSPQFYVSGIWVINLFIAYQCASYIIGFTVIGKGYWQSVIGIYQQGLDESILLVNLSAYLTALDQKPACKQHRFH